MPAYNAAGHITSVVERIPHDLWHHIADVWIINDGSTDTTKQVVESLITTYGAIRAIHLERLRFRCLPPRRRSISAGINTRIHR